jgi:hypothetical protein
VASRPKCPALRAPPASRAARRRSGQRGGVRRFDGGAQPHLRRPATRDGMIGIRRGVSGTEPARPRPPAAMLRSIPNGARRRIRLAVGEPGAVGTHVAAADAAPAVGVAATPTSPHWARSPRRRLVAATLPASADEAVSLPDAAGSAVPSCRQRGRPQRHLGGAECRMRGTNDQPGRLTGAASHPGRGTAAGVGKVEGAVTDELAWSPG